MACKKQSLCLRLEPEDVAEATIINSSILQKKLKELIPSNLTSDDKLENSRNSVFTCLEVEAISLSSQVSDREEKCQSQMESWSSNTQLAPIWNERSTFHIEESP